jgi:hypothetical protein
MSPQLYNELSRWTDGNGGGSKDEKKFLLMV